MCSRFELNTKAREVRMQFSLVVEPDPLPGPIFRPTDPVLVVAPNRTARTLPWGLQVSWSPRPLINARAETLREKLFFRPMLGNRVLVPATAYFEWKDEGAGGKIRHRIAPERNAPFAMAGLTDGSRLTIVTCEPAPAIADIHSRMPVILADSDSEDAWLAGCPLEDVLLPYRLPLRALREQDPAPKPKPSPAQGDLFG
jgi:putative SOS response-associated peptidase YedK